MMNEKWCEVHATFEVACCNGNTEERAVPARYREVASRATLPPVFGTAIGSVNGSIPVVAASSRLAGALRAEEEPNRA